MRIFTFLIILTFCSGKLWPQKFDGVLKLNGNSTIVKSDSIMSKSQNLFNFHPAIKLKPEDAKFTNILNEYFSIFVVFKSEATEEENILELGTDNISKKITNKYIFESNQFEYQTSKPEQGVIVSYTGFFPKFSKKNYISIEEFLVNNLNKKQKEQLLEIIYVPKLLSPREVGKIETYLSIKYGISLGEKKNYISASKDTIWNFKKNAPFNNRITGLGREDEYNLYQKQSGNSQKDGIYIGLGVIDSTNQANKSVLANSSYILWGDNEGETLLRSESKNKSSIRKMERIWKLNFKGEEDISAMKAEMMLDAKKMMIETSPESNTDITNEILWLAISDHFTDAFDYESAEYFQQSATEDGNIAFDNLSLDFMENKEAYFTFIKAPELFCTYSIVSNDCPNINNAQLSINVFGGAAPYKFQIEGEKTNVEHIVSESNFSIELEEGIFSFIVTDSNNKSFEERITIDSSISAQISIDPLWHLENGQVKVIPEIDDFQNKDALLYEWRSDGNIITTNPSFDATKEGEYELVVGTKECKTTLPFSVISNNLNVKDFAVYPNPAEAFQEFTVSFHLEKIEDVTITIFSTNGQVVKRKTFENELGIEFTDFLSTSGTYLIRIVAGENSDTFKIIIK